MDASTLPTHAETWDCVSYGMTLATSEHQAILMECIMLPSEPARLPHRFHGLRACGPLLTPYATRAVDHQEVQNRKAAVQMDTHDPAYRVVSKRAISQVHMVHS